MEFFSENKISEKIVNSLDEKLTFELTSRLVDNNYKGSFNGLKNRHSLRLLQLIELN